MQQHLYRRTLSRYALAFTLSFVLIAAASLFIAQDSQARSQRVTICHIPPGNPANAHEITISVNAVPAHVTHHGDTIGACGTGPGPGPGPGGGGDDEGPGDEEDPGETDE